MDSETNAGSVVSVRDVLDDTDHKKVAKALMDRFDVTQKEAMNEWVTKQIKGGGKFRVYDIEKANAMLQTQGYLAAVGTQSDGFRYIVIPNGPAVNSQRGDTLMESSKNMRIRIMILGFSG